MTAPQKKFYKMLDQLREEYKQKEAAYKAVPALAAAIEEALNYRIQIGATLKLQTKNLKGITELKVQMKAALADRTYQIARGISAYATDKEDPDLLTQTQVSLTYLQTLSDKMMETECQNIYDLAAANLANLSEQGIDAENLQELGDAIAAYTKIESVPRNKIINRTGETKKLEAQFAGAKKSLTSKADGLIEKLKTKDPETYQSYNAIRKLQKASPSPVKVNPLTKPEE